jgi:hypothetical protein
MVAHPSHAAGVHVTFTRASSPHVRWWKLETRQGGVWLFRHPREWYLSVWLTERRAQVHNGLGEPMRWYVRWQKGWTFRVRSGNVTP